MNLQRTTHLILTALPRAIHRRGFGIHSPWAYELIRDVFFERHHYYAYQDRQLNTRQEQQLFRIQNHYRNHPITIIEKKGQEAANQYKKALQNTTPSTILIIEHIHHHNAALWQYIVNDPNAIVTFDLGRRGIVTFDPKRIKQNYLL